MAPFMQVDQHTLPCNDCPYGGVCCSYGVTISQVEKEAITARFGDDVVYRDEKGYWRTAVRDRHCIFQADDGRCTIHSEDFYPAQCRAYPWHSVTEVGDAYVNTGVVYDQPYECPAMVLAALDAKFRTLAQHAARQVHIEELIIQLLPHTDAQL